MINEQNQDNKLKICGEILKLNRNFGKMRKKEIKNIFKSKLGMSLMNSMILSLKVKIRVLQEMILKVQTFDMI